MQRKICSLNTMLRYLNEAIQNYNKSKTGFFGKPGPDGVDREVKLKAKIDQLNTLVNDITTHPAQYKELNQTQIRGMIVQQFLEFFNFYENDPARNSRLIRELERALLKMVGVDDKALESYRKSDAFFREYDLLNDVVNDIKKNDSQQGNTIEMDIMPPRPGSSGPG